ncbi:MAG TPA: dihydrofolate reductase family protein [Jatrophihabitans sp.]|jgi:riboflavin biosynthesis pyrimidine reductase|uniref:dihydrofolate reductase family protein n=1 Tax=Jatrophihabitans sp. TaxID=1932789 RepID=UPI002F00C771
MRVLLPAGSPPEASATDDPVDLHAHYAEGWLPDGGVRVNFVCSADGAATAAGLSRGLQTPGDNAVFAALRDLADVILVGAATAAAERYRPANPSARRRAIRAELGLAEVPAIAVMSSSLQLDLSAELFSAPSQAPTLVVTGSAAPIGARNDIIDLAGTEAKLQLVQAPSAADGGVDFAASVAALRELGYRRILCEGGPRLFAAGVAGGAVDELCLSMSPMLTGPGGARIVAGEPWPAELSPRLQLTGLLTEDSALFCRYLLRRPAAA